LRFNFSIGLAAEQRRSTPSRSASTTAILPAINPAHRVHLFEIAFDKDCGEDNECHTDMVLSGTMMDLTRREKDGKYQVLVLAHISTRKLPILEGDISLESQNCPR
jgi:hypothetical protein